MDPCEHAKQITDVTPSSPDSCNTCLEMGDRWVNLRICLVCGHVGCCDNSKNKHASAHFRDTGHAVIQSYQPGETWTWCYEDEMRGPDREAFR